MGRAQSCKRSATEWEEKAEKYEAHLKNLESEKKKKREKHKGE